MKLAKSSAWQGVWTALVTPLTRSGGTLKLDEASLRKLIESQIAGGVTGLVIAGSTGEGSLLPSEVLTDLFAKSRAIAGERIPLVAGLGIGGTEAALRQGTLAKAAGFDGLLAAPPAYIKPPQRGLIEHFLQVAGIGLPVCLYDIPGRAVAKIEVASLEKIVNDPRGKNIVALKDATGDLAKAIHVKRAVGNRIACLSGDDLTYLPYLACGGDGIISVGSHVAPRALVKLRKDFVEGRLREAEAAQLKMMPFFEALFWDSNPIPVKTLLAQGPLVAEALFCAPLSPMDEGALGRFTTLAKPLAETGILS